MDVNQVPPFINIKEVVMMHGCDTHQAGLEMVQAHRLKGLPQRAEKWAVAKGKIKHREKFNHKLADEGGAVMKEGQ